MTEYVPVPVPEETVAEVKQFLLWGGKKPVVMEWTAAGMRDLLAALDAPTRALLIGVATDLVENEHVARVHEVADRLGCSDREVIGSVMELNEIVKQVVDDQKFVLWPRRGPADEPDSHRLGNWILGITDETAALIGALPEAQLPTDR